MLRESNLRASILAALAGASEALDGMSPMGAYEMYVNGELVEVVPNLVPAAARSYLLKAGVAGASQLSAFYGAPFINAIDPPSNLTAANFEATLDEFTNYSEANRVLWAQDAEANQAIENTSVLMSFTIGAGGGTVNGIALLSVNTKGSTAGTLLAATRFSTPRVLVEGDVLQFRYKLQYNAA